MRGEIKMYSDNIDSCRWKEELFRFIDTSRNDILNFWKEIVNLEGRYDEVNDLSKLAGYLKQMFEEEGVECHLLDAGHKIAPVLTGILGKDIDAPAILFSGHYDTVFKRGTLGPEPFKIIGDRAYGPGVLDMKGGIAITLLCVRALNYIGFKSFPIKIVFVGDEESGRSSKGNSTIQILSDYARGALFGFNMETGVVDGGVCVGRKGGADYTITVRGVSSHPGNAFVKGRNAIEDMAHKIIALQSITPKDYSYTVSVDTIEGGTASNIIPEICKIKVDVRFSTQKDYIKIFDEIKEICKKTYVDDTSTELTVDSVMPPYETTENVMKLYKHIVTTAKKYGLCVPSENRLGGASDASSVSAVEVPVLCSCGVPGDGNHTNSEYAFVNGLFERAKLLCAAIIDAHKFGY